MHYLDCPNSDATQIYKHPNLVVEKFRVCIYIHIASRETFKVSLLKNAFRREWLSLCNVSRWYLDLHVIVIAHQHLLKPHAKVCSRSCCSKNEKFDMIFPDMPWYFQTCDICSKLHQRLWKFAGIGDALADVKSDNDRLGWEEVKVMIGTIFGIVLELCAILDCLPMTVDLDYDRWATLRDSLMQIIGAAKLLFTHYICTGFRC